MFYQKKQKKNAYLQTIAYHNKKPFILYKRRSYANHRHMSQSICAVLAQRSDESARYLKNIRRERSTSDSPRAPAAAGRSEDEHNTHNNLPRSSHAALL